MKAIGEMKASEIRAEIKALGYRVTASSRAGVRGPCEATAVRSTPTVEVKSASGHLTQLEALRALLGQIAPRRVSEGSKIRTESGKVLTVTKVYSGVFNLPWGPTAMTVASTAEETGFYDVRRVVVVG